MSELNIYQRVSAITNELKAVAKNLDVGVGKNSYKAVSEADVLATVKPLEEKYGVYSYAYDREIVDQKLIQWEEDFIDKYNFKDDKGKTVPTLIVKQKKLFFMRIKTYHKFVNIDKPEDFMTTVTLADGLDAGDKASGKALTYADKYSVLKAYKMITGDDPDQYHSDSYSNNNYKKKEKQNNDDREMVIGLIDNLLKNEPDKRKNLLEYYVVDSLNKLTEEQAVQAFNKLNKK